MYPGLSTFGKHGQETMLPGLPTFEKHGQETMFPGLSTFGKHDLETIVWPTSGNMAILPWETWKSVKMRYFAKSYIFVYFFYYQKMEIISILNL